MSTRFTSKLAALAAALMMNGLIIAGAAHLFDGRPPACATAVVLARA